MPASYSPLFTLLVIVSSAGFAVEPSTQLPWPDKTGPTYDGRALPKDALNVPTEWMKQQERMLNGKYHLKDKGIPHR